MTILLSDPRVRAVPVVGGDDLERLTSRFVAPLDVAPQVAGAAVDLTLVDACGDELDLGTPTPGRIAGCSPTSTGSPAADPPQKPTWFDDSDPAVTQCGFRSPE